jgi:predicted DNA-binding protein (MmcQ/YjbR family)
MKDMDRRKAAPRPVKKGSAAQIGSTTEKLKAILEAIPGADAVPVPVPHGRPAPAVMYKLMGKMFAILSIRGDAFVIVKCDPGLADIVRQTYSGVGHRSHLDRRFWISIDLDTDVPLAEIRKLIAGSYDLIYASLTRKQKEELAARLQD